MAAAQSALSRMTCSSMAAHFGRVLLLLLCGFAVAPASNAVARQAATQPNIVLILADDLGWADLPLYGNRFNETPRLARLAAEGIRFTQFYAGPVCSPTRANLQSGRDQARFGITQHIPGFRRPFAKLVDPIIPPQLPLQVETFAERLRTAGYMTGYFGKWHLGGEGYGPSQQGWDVAFEHQGHTIAPPAAGGGAGRRAAEVLAEKAVAFIEANRGRPFLLQVSPYAVHIPISAQPELQQKYAAKKPMPGYPSRADYAGLLEELDSSVGKIVGAIDRMGLSRNTLVIFISDNGGLEHEQNGTIVTSNAPLRGEKGSLYEGGIRVPALMRWPGIVPAGVVLDTPATTMDIYPTLMEVAGAPLPADAALDGLSIGPVLRNPRSAIRREALYWHLPHYHHSTPASAVRRGDWKLIEFFEDDRVELYNLRDDPAERQNRAAGQPQKARDLRADLSRWRRQVGAQMPKPNSAYDPARANELAGRAGGRRSGR
jgi:arylsulfatase A